MSSNSPRDWLKPVLSAGILLVPLWYAGLSEKADWLPSPFRQIFRATGVFEKLPSLQSNYFVEIQINPDSPWVRWQEELFFHAKPWGNKSRFQDLMATLQKDNGIEEQKELARWILQTQPGTTPYSKLRFVRETLPFVNLSNEAAKRFELSIFTYAGQKVEQ